MMSPGTISSTGVSATLPSRRTAARTATECLRASTAFCAVCSCITSSAIEAVRMTRMMAPLAKSPTAAETIAATMRMAISGSASRLPILARMCRRAVSAITLRPPLSSRRAASSAVRPAGAVLSAASSSPAPTVQNSLGVGSAG